MMLHILFRRPVADYTYMGKMISIQIFSVIIWEKTHKEELSICCEKLRQLSDITRQKVRMDLFRRKRLHFFTISQILMLVEWLIDLRNCVDACLLTDNQSSLEFYTKSNLSTAWEKAPSSLRAKSCVLKGDKTGTGFRIRGMEIREIGYTRGLIQTKRAIFAVLPEHKD